MSSKSVSNAMPTISFPAIRGVQAGNEYFVSMWTFRMLRQISLFDEDDLGPELRAQRILNRSRLPEITEYILRNQSDYVFSALTVSIDSDVLFEPLLGQENIGMLRVPMDGRFIVNDGQHRRAAILAALQEKPNLANETIAIVFFLDHGLSRCQQMFADLNHHAVRPSRSLGLLYDHRSERARLAKLVMTESNVFRNVVDVERTSLARRSRKLFTLSAMHSACTSLIDGLETGDMKADVLMVREFWDEVAINIPDWLLVRDGKIPASELRESFVHSHGIVLHAIGHVGNALLKDHPRDWREKLRALKEIDWSKSNVDVWEGRAMVGGRMSKLNVNVQLSAIYIKQRVGVTLSESDEALISRL